MSVMHSHVATSFCAEADVFTELEVVGGAE
jgi:hypothetical protein